MKIVPVVLAGGCGSRLWPLSRKSRPKQFLSLLSRYTLLQETLMRLKGLDLYEPIVISNDEYRFLVAEQLHEIGIKAQILLEPVGRNTAPAVALAAWYAQVQYGKQVMLLILPADHVITGLDELHRAINKAVEAAESGRLVTFGVKPTGAETGYGYIHAAAKGQQAVFPVQAFIEKPDLQTAKQLVAQDFYYWNSGMFVFQADIYLAELKQYQQDIHDICKISIQESSADLDFIRIPKDLFEKCPADSIDYAVMENSTQVGMVPLQAGWSDVGNWTALSEVKDKDQDGNDQQGDVCLDGCSNISIHATHRMVAAIGLQDLIIVETEDAVLIAQKTAAESIKMLVNRLNQDGRVESEVYTEVRRPWGKYSTLAQGERFKVKRITVKPGARLSLQKHFHRAEHWVVVSGVARVMRGQETYAITENQSTYIPCGEVHRLENPGSITLELIEVQSGTYLGEDDILRLDDAYGRSG